MLIKGHRVIYVLMQVHWSCILELLLDKRLNMCFYFLARRGQQTPCQLLCHWKNKPMHIWQNQICCILSEISFREYFLLFFNELSKYKVMSNQPYLNSSYTMGPLKNSDFFGSTLLYRKNLYSSIKIVMNWCFELQVKQVLQISHS